MGKIESLIKLALIMMVPIMTVALCVSIAKLFKSYKKIKNDGYTEFVFRLITLLCVVVSFVVWVSHPDMYRIVLTAIGIPVIHTVLFMIVCSLSSNYVKESKLLMFATILSFVAYPIMYIFMPGDAHIGSYGTGLFGFVTDGPTVQLCLDIALRGLQVSTFIMILQTLIMFVVKKGNSKKAEENPIEECSEEQTDPDNTESEGVSNE